MIRARFVYEAGDRIRRFRITGHAGYAEEGSDIICSAVSVLSIAAVNAVESLTEAGIRYEEADGALSCEILDIQNPEAQLLLKALVLGLTSVRDSYGEAYLTLEKVPSC